jgi:uncharacterized protein YutE (UPF0331/DUF86 family)
MADDVLINKVAIVERCLMRIDEEYAGDINNLKINFTKQDSIILNLERACEASIDIAMRLVRKYNLGIPQESREAFDLLFKAGKIDEALGHNLKSMVGFRNVAVHDYQAVNLDVVASILTHHLSDLKKWAQLALQEARER